MTRGQILSGEVCCERDGSEDVSKKIILRDWFLCGKEEIPRAPKGGSIMADGTGEMFTAETANPKNSSNWHF